MNATHVVWSTAEAQSRVIALPIAGGSDAVLAPSVSFMKLATAPELADGNAFLLDDRAGDGCHLYRAPLDGSPATEYSETLAEGCSELTTAGGFLYIMNSKELKIHRVNFDPAETKQMATLQSVDNDPGFAGGNLFVYWASGGIWRMAISGGAADEIVPSSDLPAYPAKVHAVTSDGVYFSHTDASLIGHLYRVPETGGTLASGVEDLANGLNKEFKQVQLSGSNIYWMDSGAVMRVPVAGGAPETVIPSSVQAFTVDATTIYFTEAQGNGAVLYKQGL